MGLDLGIDKCSRKNKEIIEEIAYFRKVNFLIPFFENYFNTSIENNTYIEITKDSIKTLKDYCNKVYNNHKLASKLLPTCSGFFFGNIEYNKDYYDDVYQVMQSCKNILKEFDNIKDSEYLDFWINY